MKKNCIAALMAMAMAGSLLAGCGSSGSSAAADTTAAEAASEAASVLEETESVAEEAATVAEEAATEDPGDTAGKNVMNEINADPYQVEAESRLDPDTALTLRILSVDGLTITADKLELARFDEDEIAAAKGGEVITALDGIQYNVVDAADAKEIFGEDIGNDVLVEIEQSSVNPDILLEQGGQYAYPLLDQQDGIVAFPLVAGSTALLDTVEEGRTYELAEDAVVTVLKEDFSTVEVDPADFANVSYEDGYMNSAAGMLVRVNIGDGTIATMTQVYLP